MESIVLVILATSTFSFAILTIKFKSLESKRSVESELLKKELEQYKQINEENRKLSAENLRLVQSEGMYKESRETIQRVLTEKEIIERKNSELLDQMHDVETRWKLVSQERDALKKEREDWEKDKTGILGKLSESLIVKGGATFNKTTEELREEFKRVINKVCSLDDDTKKMDKEIDKAVRALLYPGSAGLSSETTLENLLKASGLRQKLSKEDDGDFILQSTLDNGNGERSKRPDAVIYMPNNHYIVIDSKSSSHFLDLQDAVDSGDITREKDLLMKIKTRMRSHLNDLTSRDYQKAQLDYINAKEENGILPTVITVMFLQTDKMLDVVRKADKDFEMDAYKKDIFVATPMGLKNLLNSSKFVIAKGRQNFSIEKIKDELINLLENIYSMAGNADKVGKKLSGALKSYQDFASVFNRNVLTRGKKLSKLGINSKLNNMTKLDTYEVTKNVVEVEGEIEDEVDNSDEKKLIEE